MSDVELVFVPAAGVARPLLAAEHIPLASAVAPTVKRGVDT
jgi:hypothetical protein